MAWKSKNKTKQKKKVSIVSLGTPVRKNLPKRIPVKKESINLPEVLQLNERLFQKYILPYIKPLKDNATKDQKKETALKLLEIIRTNRGLAGITYEEGTHRMVKSPNQVLTPEKDGKLRADCDELAFLYISVAERLNLTTEDFSILEIKFNFSEGNSNHAVVLNIGNEVFELTTGKVFRINGTKDKELNDAYTGKTFNKKKILSASLVSLSKGGKEIGATYYETRANESIKKEKNIVKAIEYFEKAYKLKPTDERKGKIIKNSFFMVDKLLKRKDYKTIEKYLKKILKYEKTNEKAHYGLGVCYSKGTKERDKIMAIGEFEKATSSSDGKLVQDAYYNLLSLKIDLGYIDWAKKTIKKIKQKDIETSGISLLIGNIYYIESKYKKATEAYDKSILLNKKQSMAYHNKAIIFCNLATNKYKAGKYKEAIEDFKKALKIVKKGRVNCSSDVNYRMFLKLEERIKRRLEG